MRVWELILLFVASCNATTRVSFGSSIQGRRAKASLGHRATFVSTTTGPPSDPVWDIRHLLPEANLQNNTVVNLTVQLGATAFLPCKFRNLADNHVNEEQCLQVSWVRRRDWHILTTGLFTYTNDQRFTVLHPRDSEDWTLQIKYTTARDNGTYECQLSTGTGVSSQFVYMRVVEPRAIIVGGDLHVQRGSSIRLVCVIEQSPTPPKYVFWFHHNRMVNYDTHRGGINVTTTPGVKTLSRLTIADAQEADSGNYTCAAPNTRPDSAGVFVYYGDNTAAIQRRKSSGAWSLMVTTHFLLVAGTSLITSLASLLVPSAEAAPDPPDVRTESEITTKDTDQSISSQRTAEPRPSVHIVTSDWSR